MKMPREDFLKVVMETADLDVWENELVSGKVTRKATKVYAELGYTEQEAGDCMDNIFAIIHPEDVDRMRNALNDHASGKTPKYQCEFRIRAKSGAWVWYANSGKIVKRADQPDAKHLIGVTYNIHARRQQEEELKRLNLELSGQKEQLEQLNASLHQMAMTDALTQLPNRRLLIDRVSQALHSAKRTQQIGALLFLDADNFKAVNDQYGHEVGDLLLKEIAARLRLAVREADTVARISGDEFVVMLENLGTDAIEAAKKTRAIAEKILLSLAQPYVLGEIQCTNTVSIGATLMNEGQQGFDDLCPTADAAMYQAKKAGRNTFHMFVPALQKGLF
ncbi:sensor domain-containing diguanylate cyclase [Roseateles oligotrophus]|uniref:Sensor domain-containing diguanylate cyclase n=1 Tax=Roseateles oligotrophus TaxID=1769250 RepID=A0ABT2YKK3_9BURK|nr:sensor domain-containing diguanylate cyclase [Roseateles oligotrophus]MCV2370542.1 sensor domain-containing diguanylate cyclase [Roseateles oligotrophus]